MELKEIFKRLQQLQNNSYAKYSNYRVAAIVKTDKGYFDGVNVENGAFPLSVCAERTAIANAISNGAKSFEELYLLTDSKDGFGMPCGGCRQVISEFYTPDQKIIVFDYTGAHKVFLLKELLPCSWNSSTLDRK